MHSKSHCSNTDPTAECKQMDQRNGSRGKCDPGLCATTQFLKSWCFDDCFLLVGLVCTSVENYRNFRRIDLL